MKANELMIGDWVYLNYWDGKYAQQIHGINYHSWKGEGYADWVDTEIDDEASIENIEPIPLTPEILEKNGLKYEADYGGYHRSILGSHAKDNEPLICVQWNPRGEISQWEVSNKSGILTGVVAYGYTVIAVHELQHILRMVGLNELANNFKI